MLALCAAVLMIADQSTYLHALCSRADSADGPCVTARVTVVHMLFVCTWSM
jgi:hypothetical protein